MTNGMHEFECIIGKNKDMNLKVVVSSESNRISLQIQIQDLNTDETFSGSFSPESIIDIFSKIGQKLSFESFLRQFICSIKSYETYNEKTTEDPSVTNNVAPTKNNFIIITYDNIIQFKQTLKSPSKNDSDKIYMNQQFELYEKPFDKIYLLFIAKTDDDSDKTMNIPLALNLIKPKNMIKIVDNIVQSCHNKDLASDFNEFKKDPSINNFSKEIKKYQDFTQQFNSLNHCENSCDDYEDSKSINNGCCAKYKKLCSDSLNKIQNITLAMNKLKEEMKFRDETHKKNEEMYLDKIMELQRLKLHGQRSYQRSKRSFLKNNNTLKKNGIASNHYDWESTSDSDLSDDDKILDYNYSKQNNSNFNKSPCQTMLHHQSNQKLSNRSRNNCMDHLNGPQSRRKRLTTSFSTINRSYIPSKLFEFDNNLRRSRLDDIPSPKRVARRNVPLRHSSNQSNGNSIDAKQSKTHSGIIDRKPSSKKRFKVFDPTDYVKRLDERRARSFSLRDSRLERARSLSRGEERRITSHKDHGNHDDDDDELISRPISSLSCKNNDFSSLSSKKSTLKTNCDGSFKQNNSRMIKRETCPDMMMDIEQRLARLQQILA